MTIESVNYISDLDPTNPKGSDAIAEGDNHIRNIKDGLLNTFPNVTGEVTATHEELSQLSGLVEPVPPALPEVPTEEGSMLTNVSSKWSETVVLKIANDKAVIPAFAGMGNLNLYVNNEGEVVASELATDPSIQHDLNFHTDVDFDHAPEKDDILVFDGTSWKSKKTIGGNMVPAFEQPQSAGIFSLNGAGSYLGSVSATDKNGDGTDAVFTVPSNMRFLLTTVYCPWNNNGLVASFDAKDVSVDGKVVFDSDQQFRGAVQQYPDMFDPFPGREMPFPMIQAEDEIVVRVKTLSTSGTVKIVINGYFVEDI